VSVTVALENGIQDNEQPNLNITVERPSFGAESF